MRTFVRDLPRFGLDLERAQDTVAELERLGVLDLSR
jgi:hypothetical protein